MNSIGFDIDKVKIIHLLGLHEDLKIYPSPDDIIYYVCKRAYDKRRKADVTFTNKLLDKKYENKNNLNKSIDKLLKSNIITITKDSGDKISYKVLKNPFI